MRQWERKIGAKQAGAQRGLEGNPSKSVGGKVRMENSERGREAAVLEPVAHRLVHQIPAPLTY